MSMKYGLEKIKEKLLVCQNSFNLVSSRCDYSVLGDNFKRGYECGHPHHLKTSNRPQICSIDSCIVIHKDVAYHYGR